MKFQDPEVVELGLASDLIEITFWALALECFLIPDITWAVWYGDERNETGL